MAKGTSFNCLIGLTDIAEEGNFTWSDGTVRDFGRTYEQYPWNDDNPDAIADNNVDDCVALTNGYGIWFQWSDQKCTNRKFICNKPSEICFQDNWTEGPGGQYFSWSPSALPRSGCSLTNNQNLNRSAHEIALDIAENNWYAITIGYTFKIIDYYVPSRVGIYMTIAEYDTTRTNALWIG